MSAPALRNDGGDLAVQEKTLGGEHAKTPGLHRGVQGDRFVVPRVRAASFHERRFGSMRGRPLHYGLFRACVHALHKPGDRRRPS